MKVLHRYQNIQTGQWIQIIETKNTIYPFMPRKYYKIDFGMEEGAEITQTQGLFTKPKAIFRFIQEVMKIIFV